MVYIPNPADPTQPTGNVDASTADDEFRALKAYILGLALATGLFTTIRQVAADGVKDANGFPAFLVTAGGGGLNLDLDCTPTPLVVNFAGGNMGVGQNDRIGYLTNDVANVVTLDPLNTDYIYADYVAQANWTWGKTLVPPQYGYAYDRTKQALLHFEGADTTTSMIDDYGNTWAAVGNAQIDTAQFKIGTSSLLLDGTGDYIESTNFTSLGGGSWTLEAWVRFNALPGAAQTMVMLNASNSTAGTFGARLGLNNTAGTFKLAVALSSTGAADDIAAGTLGTSTVYAINTWYHFVVCYDALAGKYFVYKDGILDQTVVSAARICALTKMRIGNGNIGTAIEMNGWVDEFRYSPCCRYPNGVAFIAPTVVSAVEGDFFDVQAYKMYSPTAASIVAATNPTLTQKYRLYLGETDTSAVATTAIRNYAFNGKYTSADFAVPGAGVTTTLTANIGIQGFVTGKVMARNYIADNGWTPGEIAETISVANATSFTYPNIGFNGRNLIYAISGNAASPMATMSRSGGAGINVSAANWKLFVTAQRTF